MNLEEELKKAGIYPVALLDKKKEREIDHSNPGEQDVLKTFFKDVYN